jgi:hypothetical protein
MIAKLKLEDNITSSNNILINPRLNYIFALLGSNLFRVLCISSLANIVLAIIVIPIKASLAILYNISTKFVFSN